MGRRSIGNRERRLRGLGNVHDDRRDPDEVAGSNSETNGPLTATVEQSGWTTDDVMMALSALNVLMFAILLTCPCRRVPNGRVATRRPRTRRWDAGRLGGRRDRHICRLGTLTSPEATGVGPTASETADFIVGAYGTPPEEGEEYNQDAVRPAPHGTPTTTLSTMMASGAVRTISTTSLAHPWTWGPLLTLRAMSRCPVDTLTRTPGAACSATAWSALGSRR
ncbi:hypothetical protein C9J85_03095 [Haloferax sp. wsp5]|nr:hypothetical protein C9J85_03095 [Haloferax sp. wsp5]